MEKYSDKELAQLSSEGDTEVFNFIVSKNIKLVYNFIYRLTGNKDEAHDLTQETFIKTWKNINKYDGRASLKTWITMIARNTTIDWLRKRKDYTFSSIDKDDDGFFEETLRDTEPLPDELFEQEELSTTLENALNTLSIEQKTVVILHYKNGMTFEEISEVVKVPMNTVKSRYRRALKALKKELENAPK